MCLPEKEISDSCLAADFKRWPHAGTSSPYYLCCSNLRSNFSGDTMKQLWPFMFLTFLIGGLLLEAPEIIPLNRANASANEDTKTVAALDNQYQAAVGRNDAVAMDHFLADDFVLVTGSGKSYTKADLLEEARSGRFVYEHQEDTQQTVRVWGDTAIVTAKLWAKGAEDGKPFNYRVWFSDTYVRTPTGWRYVFGQSSLRLSESPE